jgi:hypothetical protein
VWRTSPASKKISSDAAAIQLLPGHYRETGIDSDFHLFIFPDHSYVETESLTPGILWEEVSWRFDRGLIEVRSRWQPTGGRAARTQVYLPIKVSSEGTFGLFWSAKPFAELPADLHCYGHVLEKPITAADIPDLEKKFRHLRLLIEARQQFVIFGNGDEEPPSGNQDILVFKPGTNGGELISWHFVALCATASTATRNSPDNFGHAARIFVRLESSCACSCASGVLAVSERKRHSACLEKTDTRSDPSPGSHFSGQLRSKSKKV